MEIFTLYVGQGNLAVVVGDSEAIIVDANIPPKNDEKGEFVKAALAKILAGKNVVGLMLTGFDDDHADPRGVGWIVGKYLPNWVMYPKYRKDSSAANAVFSSITRATTRRRRGNKPLERIPVRLDKVDDRLFDALSAEWNIEVFSPHPEDMTSSNNSSLVAKIVPKNGSGFTYLVTGDTENDRWETINRIFGKRLRADVMAAPHHGSRNAAHPETLRLVAPTVVLVSAGIDNQFGHPHKEALQVYGWSEVHSTHLGQSLRTYKWWFLFNTKPWTAEAKAA